jgi:hypothetical protein
MAVVTGPDCYRMISVDDNFAGARVTVGTVDTSISADVQEMQKFGSMVSTNYTSHCWTLDTMALVICTDSGDILLMDFVGKFKTYL